MHSHVKEVQQAIHHVYLAFDIDDCLDRLVPSAPELPSAYKQYIHMKMKQVFFDVSGDGKIYNTRIQLRLFTNRKDAASDLLNRERNRTLSAKSLLWEMRDVVKTWIDEATSTVTMDDRFHVDQVFSSSCAIPMNYSDQLLRISRSSDRHSASTYYDDGPNASDKLDLLVTILGQCHNDIMAMQSQAKAPSGRAVVAISPIDREKIKLPVQEEISVYSNLPQCVPSSATSELVAGNADSKMSASGLVYAEEDASALTQPKAQAPMLAKYTVILCDDRFSDEHDYPLSKLSHFIQDMPQIIPQGMEVKLIQVDPYLDRTRLEEYANQIYLSQQLAAEKPDLSSDSDAFNQQLSQMKREYDDQLDKLPGLVDALLEARYGLGEEGVKWEDCMEKFQQAFSCKLVVQGTGQYPGSFNKANCWQDFLIPAGHAYAAYRHDQSIDWADTEIFTQKPHEEVSTPLLSLSLHTCNSPITQSKQNIKRPDYSDDYDSDDVCTPS